MKLVKADGTVVVSYEYDPYGNIISSTNSVVTSSGSLAEINPLRYRGYYYDTDSNLYYCQSRYYDPELGRFLIPDVVFDYDAGVQGYDLFTYCGNSPVNRVDASGADSLQFDDGEQELDETAAAGCTPAGRFNALVTSITEQLKGCASRANASVSGKGPVVGTQKHTAFGNGVRQLNIPDVHVEASYSNGDETYYGAPGSIRFDVVLVDSSGNPIYAWDFKTGSATLSASRIDQMQSRSGFYVQIQIVR